MSKEDLQLSEDKKLYPPRFVITVTGSNCVENSHVAFIFEGGIQEFSKEISLTKGIFHMITKLLFDVYSIMGDTLSEILRFKTHQTVTLSLVVA